MGLPQRIPPEEQGRLERGGGARFEKKNTVRWPIVGIIVALALVAAIVYYLPRGPKNTAPAAGAEIPQQPTVNALAVRNVTVTPGPTGGSALVQGMISNNGNQPVTEITANVTLRDNNGTIVQQSTLPLQELRTSRGGQPETVEFSQAPLNPGHDVGFRIQLANVPASWNHAVPELQFEHVTLKGGNAEGTPTPANQQGTSVQTGPPASNPAPATGNQQGNPTPR